MSNSQQSPCVQHVIDAAAKVGVELSEKKATKILNELKNYATAKAPEFGGDVIKALNSVTQEALISAQIKAEAHKRAKVLVLLRKRGIINIAQRFMQEGLTAGEGVTALLEGSAKDVFGSNFSVYTIAENYHKNWSGEVGSKVEAVIPWSELRTKVHDLDIAKETNALANGTDAPGFTGNPVAAQVAKIFHESWLQRTKLLNDAGTYRRPSRFHYGIQSHDAALMMKQGMVKGVYDKEVAFKTWATDMLGWVDPVETFRGNPPLATLRSAFDNLETRDHTHSAWEGTETFPNGLSLADRVSEVEKLFVFKDAESYLAHQQKYGARDLADSVFNSIANDARSLALLEKVGPGGKDTLTKAIKELRDIVQERPDSKKQMDALKREESIMGAWRVASGEADLPGKGWLANAQANMQNITALATQGPVLLSATTDPAFQNIWSSRVGIKTVDILMKDLSYFSSTGKSTGEIGAKRAALKAMGVMPETYTRMSVGRVVQSDPRSRRLAGWLTKMYEWNGMNKWTQDLKMASADALMVYLGEQVHLPMDKLTPENQILLRRYAITPAEWSEMAAGKQTVGDATWLTGEGLAPKLQNKIRAMVLSEIDVAVPTPGARERRLLTFGGTQAGTFGGTVARLIGFLHSYGVTVNSKILPNEVYGSGSKTWKDHFTRGRSWYRAAGLAASTFVLGYVGISAREALSGKKPRSILNPDNSIHWDNMRDIAQQSGAAGIVGDLVLQEWKRGFKDPSTYASGVLMQKYVDPLATIPWDFVRGDDRAVGKAVSAIGGLVPFGNMLFARQAADYVFLSSLQEMFDPGSLRRAEDAATKRTGQEYFYRPSEAHLKTFGR